MGSLRDAIVGYGRVLWARSVLSTAALRPAARDQRPRRGRGSLWGLGRIFELPASWPLLPLRDGRRSACVIC